MTTALEREMVPEAIEPDRTLLPPLRWDWYLGVFALIVLVGGVLRFWDLGTRALHHDESLHAVYSWYLYTGRGYQHDPLMHGPVQFHLIALVYFLLGASDYTARVAAAFFGTALVALPLFLRPWLGRWGAVAAAVLLAFSPLMLYYSRFARGDIYIVAWHLLLVIAMWRYFVSEDRRYLWLGAAALGLAFATKEVTYLTAVIFGLYLVAVSWREVWPRVRQRFDLRGLGSRGSFLVLMGTLVVPQGAASVLLVMDKLGISRTALGAWQSPDQPEVSLFLHAGADETKTFILLAAVLAPLFVLSAAIAWRWNWRLWLGAAAFFYIPYVVLYTTFFTNLPGFGSGIWGSLEYWIAQQPVARGTQPWFYYLLLLSIYEFLPGLLALTGIIYFGVVRRFEDRFAAFLVWWLAGSFVLYAYAGEKMPWLSLHMLLPVILLAAKTVGEFAPRFAWRRVWYSRAVLLVPAVLLALLALRATVLVLEGLRPGPTLFGQLLQGTGAAIVLLVVLVTLYRLTQGLPRRLLAQGFVAGLIALSGALTLRAGWQASYAHGDIPVEMMVYTQTSPEVPRIFRQIERIAAETGQGKNLAVTVDANQGFTWPWAWYLRDYKNVDYPDFGVTPGEPRGTVLLLNANDQAAEEPYLTRFDAGQRFPHRWWFPEFYKDFPVPELLSKLFTPEGFQAVWNYLYARDVGQPLGSSDAIVYYPRGPSGDLGSGTPGNAPAGQATQAVPRPGAFSADLSMGQRGAAPGGLLAPKGVATDPQGNFYVVDSDAARVSKFDPAGRFVTSVGQKGTGDGEFTEPWGVALDGVGNVYVADTWNHRIQKFDGNLKFLTRWGSFASVPNGGPASPGSFYGPRAIAVDGAGFLYVIDTGNKRVQKFAPDGTFLGAFGSAGRGQGQFQEPVGIAITASGEILVADTWNRRVQRFDREFKYLSEFPVAGWAGQSVTNKPYLAVDGSGNLLLTDPDTNRIFRYSLSGALLNVYGQRGADLSSFSQPAAVAVDGLGRVVVSDSGNARVLRIPTLE